MSWERVESIDTKTGGSVGWHKLPAWISSQMSKRQLGKYQPGQCCQRVELELTS